MVVLRRHESENAKDTVENEANNGLKNDSGTISMARTMDPHSASSQFFINVNDNNFKLSNKMDEVIVFFEKLKEWI